jgi:hypothetical protein
MIESTQMGHHKAHESKNQKVFTTYIDGILVDGSNILYTMVPKGEFGFRKLMTLHTRLCKTTGLQPRKVKLILDENMPYLLGVKPTSTNNPKSRWSAYPSDIRKFKEISQLMSQEDNYLTLAYAQSADELISEMLEQYVIRLKQNWFVLSNDKYNYLESEKISRKIDILVHKGKLTAEQRDITSRNLENKLRVLKNMIDGYFILKNNPNIHGNNPIHNGYCRRLKYSNVGDSITYLDYTLEHDLRLMATRNSSNLSRQKKVKLLK